MEQAPRVACWVKGTFAMVASPSRTTTPAVTVVETRQGGGETTTVRVSNSIVSSNASASSSSERDDDANPNRANTNRAENSATTTVRIAQQHPQQLRKTSSSTNTRLRPTNLERFIVETTPVVAVHTLTVEEEDEIMVSPGGSSTSMKSEALEAAADAFVHHVDGTKGNTTTVFESGGVNNTGSDENEKDEDNDEGLKKTQRKKSCSSIQPATPKSGDVARGGGSNGTVGKTITGPDVADVAASAAAAEGQQMVTGGGGNASLSVPKSADANAPRSPNGSIDGGSCAGSDMSKTSSSSSSGQRSARTSSSGRRHRHTARTSTTLSEVWDAFKEWSAFGVAVPLIMPDGKECEQCYVPYLSSLHVYEQRGKTRHAAGSSDSEIDEDDSSDGSSMTSCSASSLPFSMGSDDCAHHHHHNHHNHHHHHHHNHHNHNHNHNQGVECARKLVPCFQYVETEQPSSRLPLYEKLQELQRGASIDLFNTRTDEVHSMSWMAIAWYPIYMIPANLARQQATFLTFHSLNLRNAKARDLPAFFRKDTAPEGPALSNAGKDRLKERLENESMGGPGGRDVVPMKCFACTCYKMPSKIWLGPNSEGVDLSVQLNSASSFWLRRVNAQQHDHDFFTSSKGRRTRSSSMGSSSSAGESADTTPSE